MRLKTIKGESELVWSSFISKGKHMKCLEGKEPNAVFIVEITHEQLRLMADRIETKLKSAQEGQSIVTPFADQIVLITPVPSKKQ